MPARQPCGATSGRRARRARLRLGMRWYGPPEPSPTVRSMIHNDTDNLGWDLIRWDADECEGPVTSLTRDEVLRVRELFPDIWTWMRPGAAKAS